MEPIFLQFVAVPKNVHPLGLVVAIWIWKLAF